jgi:hypothetical protein
MFGASSGINSAQAGALFPPRPAQGPIHEAGKRSGQEKEQSETEFIRARANQARGVESGARDPRRGAANGPVAPTYQRKERAWAISPTKTVIANGAMQTATRALQTNLVNSMAAKTGEPSALDSTMEKKAKWGQGGCRLSRRGIEGNRNRQ